MGHLARQISGYKDQLRIIPQKRKYTKHSQVHCGDLFGRKKGINNKYIRNKNKIEINRNMCSSKSKETLKLSSNWNFYFLSLFFPEHRTSFSTFLFLWGFDNFFSPKIKSKDSVPEQKTKYLFQNIRLCRLFEDRSFYKITFSPKASLPPYLKLQCLPKTLSLFSALFLSLVLITIQHYISF